MSKKIPKRVQKVSEPFRVDSAKHFRLKDVDPEETLGYKDEEKAKDALAEGIATLAKLQDKLYAQDKWGVLLIFQAMDAAGKDSAIKHVMSGVNPQGCQVYSFKAPSAEELDHDYLWRCMNRLPNRGQIGVFNRSYYEEVLIVRVHKEILEKEKLPANLNGKRIWKHRFEEIRNFERYLTRNGIIVRKFFLHVSSKEQKKRFIARITDPKKNWKFAAGDVAERENWDDYMDAYEDMIRNTATDYAPWYAVPADNKWFTHLVVAGAVIDALDDLKLAYPTLDEVKLQELETAKARLTKS
jgi:PPK2 family polyphosphate:nucleotide phosphotransferase